jgi:trimethylguanosine synthase
VIYCEADEKVLESAKVNARVYGVEDKIEFKLGSFLDLAPELKADGVYLAPPWTLDSETKNYAVDLKNFDLEKLSPVAGKALFAAALLVSNNIAFYISPFAHYSQVRHEIQGLWSLGHAMPSLCPHLDLSSLLCSS